MSDKRRKETFPEGLAEIADEASERLVFRQSPPRIRIEKDASGWQFSSPYAKRDDGRWLALLADAFGTRSRGVIDHFLQSIVDLVPQGEWNGERRFWYPSEADFNAVLGIVSSLRPENEAQAAHAAQLAALHLSAMKLGGQATRYGDQKTVAILAKTARAYGEGVERFARLQGRLKTKTVNQTIEVVYVDQRTANQFNGGVSPNGGQPHTATARGLPALPRLCSDDGQSVPTTRDEGQASLQDARRPWWRAIW